MGKASKGESAGKRLDYKSIEVDPQKHGGKPYVKHTDITVEEVLDLIKAGKSDKEICDIFNRHAANDNKPAPSRQKTAQNKASNKYTHSRPMSTHKIAACRAWQAWARPEELKSTFNKAANGNMVMMDENLSYRMLPEVVKLFGRSSHVIFEQLINENNDDEHDIWKHVIDNDYKLVITGDDDFIGIAMRHHKKEKIESGEAVPPGKLPAVIFVSSDIRANNRVLHYIDKYQEQIRRFIEKRDAVYAKLTPQGLVKVGKLHGSSNDNDNGKNNGNRQKPPPFYGASPA